MNALEIVYGNFFSVHALIRRMNSSHAYNAARTSKSASAKRYRLRFLSLRGRERSCLSLIVNTAETIDAKIGRIQCFRSRTTSDKTVPSDAQR